MSSREDSPLLGNAHTRDNEAQSLPPEGPPLNTLSKEIWVLLVNGLPVSISYMLQNSLQSGCVLMVGQLLDAHALSVVAQAFMLAMVSAWCLGIGGSTAFDSLASPAVAQNMHAMVSLLYRRTCIILLLLYIPIAIAWWNAASVLRFLRQDEDLGEGVQQFLRVLAFGAPGYILFETTKKFCQVQGAVHAATLTLCVTSPINLLLNYFLIHQYGLPGAAIATSISYWGSFLILALYSRSGQPKKCWIDIPLALLCEGRAAIQLLKLLVPGFFMVATEWWAFEIVALAAGRLIAPALSAQSVIMTVDQILNTLPYGLGVAASIRTGYLLGCGSSRANAQALKVSTRAATLLSTLVGSIVLLALMLARTQIARMFSADPDTIALVAKVMPLVAAFQVFDGWAGVCGGVLRGVGRQEAGAVINLAAYYGMALPLGIFLAFKKDLGLSGLWIGQVLALFLVGAGELSLVNFAISWRKETQKANHRTQEADQPEFFRQQAESLP
ncbi:hypothetical protein MYAM1_003702 [Malassezia yamatoensis]|uniref:MATE efflux family protein n=1 Tax=Malassezia yamatoensis TaxID=253288 RepID=A0AAJ6CJ51_9BASI|nr:hypothetical protein MYAM1_003702 [Malassezia yamatoensis]